MKYAFEEEIGHTRLSMSSVKSLFFTFCKAHWSFIIIIYLNSKENKNESLIMFDFLRERARELNKRQFLSDFYSSNHAEDYSPTPPLWQRHPHYFREENVPYESHWKIAVLERNQEHSVYPNIGTNASSFPSTTWLDLVILPNTHLQNTTPCISNIYHSLK